MTHEVRHVKIVPMGDLTELVAALDEGFGICGTCVVHDGNIVYTMVKFAD